MAQYIPIGSPVNDAEKEGIRLLRDLLPSHFVVIGNFDLNLPRRRNSMEFDAVVIGEHGIYAVEIKGWGGSIEGDARRWELSWGSFENPIIHTSKKAKALHDFIQQKVPDLPREVFCMPAVLLPRTDIDLQIAAEDRAFLVQPHNLWRFFVNEEQIFEFGPGALLESDLHQRIVEAIVPLASPSQKTPRLADFEIEGELDRPDWPYREFVGSHKFIRNWSRVRIKAYNLDPLAPKAQQEAERLRIYRDMEALASLEDNPYVARAYQTLQDSRDELVYYLISEWVGPRTLGEYIEEIHSEPLPEAGPEADDQRWTYALHLCRAVSFMHSRDIVHRNLHPGVIYLTCDPMRVPLKIADFDHARISNLQSIAQELTSIGTQGYIAPELWMEKDYDHRVDIFSVGVILFELFTGQALYRGLSDILQHGEIWASRRELLSCEKTRRVLDRLIASEPEQRASSLDEAIELFEQPAPTPQL